MFGGEDELWGYGPQDKQQVRPGGGWPDLSPQPAAPSLETEANLAGSRWPGGDSGGDPVVGAAQIGGAPQELGAVFGVVQVETDGGPWSPTTVANAVAAARAFTPGGAADDDRIEAYFDDDRETAVFHVCCRYGDIVDLATEAEAPLSDLSPKVCQTWLETQDELLVRKLGFLFGVSLPDRTKTSTHRRPPTSSSTAPLHHCCQRRLASVLAITEQLHWQLIQWRRRVHGPDQVLTADMILSRGAARSEGVRRGASGVAGAEA